VIGRECVVLLKVAEDAQGFQKMKVNDVKQLEKDDGKTYDSTSEDVPF
jgi:hypothetical protein